MEKEFLEFLILGRSEIDKSNSNTSKKVTKNEHMEDKTTTNNYGVKEALSTKRAVELLLEGSLKFKVCRYCLNIVTPLYELDQVFQIGGQGPLYKVTIGDMIASLCPFTIIEDPNFPNRICDKCLDTTISSYLFTQQCERSGRALRNCFEDMYEKLDKLDPLDRQKKCGRQKLNPNHNTLYSDHEKVINYADPIIHLRNRGIEITEDNKNEIHELKCSEILPNIESFLNHERIHPKSMWFNCRLCGKSYPKRHLYRKHIKTEHVLGKQIALKNTGFKCTDCGVTSEVYNEYLQHMEKHKFNMIIEHLIERRMDKLCIVCIDKGIKMNKMISLQGGCSELSCHRSLNNILGSNMPEQNSYKYQELLLPYKAKILELFNKKNNNTPPESDESTLHDIKDFPLSNPILVSELVVNRDDYIFLFTKPQEVNEKLTIENESVHIDTLIPISIANESTDKCIENDVVQEIEISNNLIGNELKNTTQENPYTGNDQFTFEKPVTNVDMFRFVKHVPEEAFECDTRTCVKEKINNGANIVKTCKVCWIFKKPSCKICLESTKYNIEQNKLSDRRLTVSVEINTVDNLSQNKVGGKIVSTLNNDCKYCWIFKNTEKCNYCNKEINTCYPVDDIFGSNNTEIAKQGDIVIKNIRKRKTMTSLDCQSKKTKWQCNICLTENVSNELCVCCDSKKYNDHNQLKILFGLNKHLFLTNDCNEEPVTVKLGIQSNENSIVLEQQKSITVTNETPKQESNLKSKIHSHDDEAHNIETTVPMFKIMENNDIITMDTEVANVTQNSNEYVAQFIPQEEMDIEENFTSEQPFNISITKPLFNLTPTAESTLNLVSTTDSSSNFIKKAECAPNFESIGKPNTQESSFNFNIGVGPIGARRIKRPLRRMATTIPK